ncbi:MAG: LysR family transcriptional regulator [Lachnospiraceae bacterium]|jgi:DNA-binding transcriptional LysR family regulator|nr:LysR family transcriptional regulator [Lachnospiraceae bacterium]
METSHIKEFLVLAKINHYGKASNELFISQSTLFTHIRLLENELGVTLFDRKGKKIELSENGKIFALHAKNIIDSINDFEQTIRDSVDEQNKTIKIGTQYQVIDLIQSFKNTHKDYKVQLLQNDNTLDSLINGKCDLAFVYDVDLPADKFESYHFFTDNVVAAVYDTHPLATRGTISLSELKNEEFITIEQHQPKEDMVITHCKEAGFFPKVSIVASKRREAALFVNAKHGISLFHREMIKAENLSNLVILDLKPPIECAIFICRNKNTELSNAAQLFLHFAIDFGNKNQS